ncbi:MAG: insulinase family protein [Chitinispirillia bacterium]|nr:insulinase family protein [Chitinispirillia bacterium]MCL2241251.1 insulinase family protein [Chitinispirillia bacterium]
MIRKILSTTLLLTALSAPLYADSRAGIDIPIFEDTLSNGLKVIVVPDTNVAVVSCRLYYFVGGMNEGPGTSGLSHMYEHMMFKGTKRLGTHDYEKEVPYLASIDSLDRLLRTARERGGEEGPAYKAYRSEIAALLDRQRQYIKKDEIWELYQVNGGTALNAWTSNNMTAYIVTLPKNKIELFYWIEADRMQNPVLREFHSEQDVVTEERRMRYDNRPVNRYWERLNAAFYAAHPFRQPVIGWASEIRGFTTDKLMRHINQFYTPDNAVLVLVGNIDPKKAMGDVEKYFGGIPRAAVLPDPVVTREPPAIGETRFTVREDIEPRVDVMFQVPGYPHDDLYALDVIEGVLSDRSGRLYKRLVDKEQLCTGAGATNAFRVHNGYFHIYASLKKGSDPVRVEKIILEEIDKLTKEIPAEREITRVSNGIRMAFASGLKSLEGISDHIAAYERLGSWKIMFEYPEKIAAVDKNSIPGVAAAYLKPELATWGFIVPKTAEAKGKK